MNELVLDVCKINSYEKALKLLKGKPSSHMQKCRLESFRKFKKKMAGIKRDLSFDLNVEEEVQVCSVKDNVRIKEGLKKISSLESLSL